MWNEIYLEKVNGEKLFVDHFITDRAAPNILYIQTPVISVTDLKACYEPLAKYGFNIFALDISGIGKSEGHIKNFTLKTFNDDISLCIAHIKENYTGKIHFYGGTGTGGILAQCYVTKSNEISSFAQYGVANHNDLSLFPYSRMIKLLYPFLRLGSKLMPEKKMKFSTPSYTGKNANKEDELYRELLRKFPGSFDMNICLLTNILGIFIDNNSPIRDKMNHPTLFIAPQHDRYFSREYLNKYNESFQCEKKMYVIDDAHSSYLWHAEEICEQVSEWFWKFS